MSFGGRKVADTTLLLILGSMPIGLEQDRAAYLSQGQGGDQLYAS